MLLLVEHDEGILGNKLKHKTTTFAALFANYN